MFQFVVKKCATIVIVALLTACTASGPTYPEYVAHLPNNNEEGRIYVYRTAVGWFDPFGSDMARLKIDENYVGGCAYRGFNTYSLTPGSHTLIVDKQGLPGKCSIEIVVETGKNHYYEVQRRYAPLAGLLAGFWIAGPVMNNSLLNSFAAAYAGFFAGALIPPSCGGQFSIEPVSEVVGREEIQEMRFCR